MGARGPNYISATAKREQDRQQAMAATVTEHLTALVVQTYHVQPCVLLHHDVASSQRSVPPSLYQSSIEAMIDEASHQAHHTRHDAISCVAGTTPPVPSCATGQASSSRHAGQRIGTPDRKAVSSRRGEQC